MSRKGDCWDNAVAESFFHTLKVELIHGKTYNTRQEAKTAIFKYIEVFYNRQRRHSYLGYLSPVDFSSVLLAFFEESPLDTRNCLAVHALTPKLTFSGIEPDEWE
jgi:putative transposase